MKKLIIIFFILLLFGCECTKREDYYSLYVDDYLVTVGYDSCDYLDVVFKYNVKSDFMANETIEDVEFRLNDNLFGLVNLTNMSDENIQRGNAIITELTLYINDLPNRKFRIDEIELDHSIKNNCDKLNGKYIEKNGYACVIEKMVNDKLDAIELHGDYININQDELDHIIIYVK